MSNPSNYLIALDDGHGMQTAGKRTPMIPDSVDIFKKMSLIGQS